MIQVVKPVFEYLDYRDLLKDAYDYRKSESPLFSYRIMAELFGLDPSYVFRVLQKDQHLPARCQPRAVEFLGLTGRAAEYFQLLVAYARERGRKARQEILEKALALRDVGRRELEDRELAVLRDWWVPVVRSLLEVVDGRARPDEISARLSPGVPVDKVASALELLLELGLIRKTGSGGLALAETHLTAGGEKKAEAVRTFQRQILGLAAESLERHPREHRDVSTLTLAVDANAFVEIREMLRECRRQIQKRVEDARRPDRVMQLSMAFFPLSTIPERAP
jgi:uncharacterized protein (TIGR02147 family)